MTNDLDDFNQFVDEVLEECANRQSGSKVEPCNLNEIARHIRSDCPPTWIQLLPDRLRDLGYGKIVRDSEYPGITYIKLNATGIAAASEARRRNNEGRGTFAAPVPPKANFWKREINWTKWGAIAAWIIIPVTVVGIIVAVWLDKN